MQAVPASPNSASLNSASLNSASPNSASPNSASPNYTSPNYTSPNSDIYLLNMLYFPLQTDRVKEEVTWGVQVTHLKKYLNKQYTFFMKLSSV